MDVYESDLPGVGKKFVVDLEGEDQLVVVIHNTGTREVFLRPGPGGADEKLFELSDQLARMVGMIVEGAYVQPIESETIQTVLDDDSIIEWTRLAEDSPVANETIGATQLRQRTGATVVAILRGDETITEVGPRTTLRPGDTLVTIGSREHQQLLLEALESPEEP